MCAWCGRMMTVAKFGQLESHGICYPCYLRVRDEIVAQSGGKVEEFELTPAVKAGVDRVLDACDLLDPIPVRRTPDGAEVVGE